MDQVRVGGETSAYCTSCRDMRLHVVVAMVGTKPARVECRSCHKQHNYKAAPPGAPRKKAEGGTTAPRKPRATKSESKSRSLAEHPLDALLAVRSAAEARTYTPFDRYVVGDLVSHPTFGLGAVAALPAPGKVEIVFRDASKLLMHERPPAGSAATPKLQPPPRRDDARFQGASDAPPKR